jgi:AcrR family transcriptional regulator
MRSRDWRARSASYERLDLHKVGGEYPLPVVTTAKLQTRPTQAERRDTTQQRLIAAAIDLFGKSGYHGTQVMDIVSQAHVSAGTFYRYFEDKQAIFFAIMEQLTRYEAQEMRAAHAALVATPDMIARVRQNAENYTRYFERVQQNAALYRALMNSGVVDQSRAHLWNLHRELVDVVVELLQSIGRLDTDDLESLARMILGTVAELRFSVVHTGKPDPVTAGRLAARFTEGALAAFSTSQQVQLPAEEWLQALNEGAPLARAGRATAPARAPAPVRKRNR